MIYLALGVLVGLLAASLLLNVVQFIAHRSELQLRDTSVSNLLDRVSTEPRIEIRDRPPVPQVDQSKHYISDFPYDDQHWNDTVTGEEE